MSIHRSLRHSGRDGGHRNVLTRAERLERLENLRVWEEGQSILGLPKVRSIKPKTSKAKRGGTEEDAAATEK